ncbi:MAG: cytochrome c [Thiohalocapsa sp.]|jgi:cytochrome c556|uniref:c-type cytochrome n=1 Tax=Thiohalocapsa sp. TaxID=2497641 RepID=UPI0025D8AAD4|nr:cytochrome c [Thiohalocapsa sp.]MCG6941572.1 cytochrome c [Thiohalocapsa sp.]
MNKLQVIVATLAAVGLAGAALAEDLSQEKVEQAIKYRKNVMTTMGGEVGTAIGRLRDGFDYGPSLEAVAAGLVANTQDIPALFPEGTDFGDTDATAEVWSDAQGFADKAQQAKDAAAAFSEAVSSGDKAAIMGAFKDLGDACKGCHEAYRKN